MGAINAICSWAQSFTDEQRASQARVREDFEAMGRSVQAKVQSETQKATNFLGNSINNLVGHLTGSVNQSLAIVPGIVNGVISSMNGLHDVGPRIIFEVVKSLNLLI